MTPVALARKLRQDAARVRGLPLERILDALDRVHAAWAAGGCPAVDAIGSATGYPPEAVNESLRHLCGSMRRADLERWLAASWPAASLVFGPRLLVIVSGGNIPGAALPSVVQGLLLRSPVLVKTATSEPHCLPAYASALKESDPEVGAALAAAAWRGGDAAIEAEVLAEADALIAYGSDETLRSLRAQVPAHARFIGYGHRISFTAIAREALSAAGGESLAAALAQDACDFDQQGCLSPHAVYVEEGGELSPAALAAHVAARLGAAPPRSSPDAAAAAAIHQYRAVAELRGLRVWASPEGTAWTVVLDPDWTLVPCPAPRTVVLRPLPDFQTLPGIAAEAGPSLISCGIAAGAERREQLIRELAAAGVTRFTRPGEAQRPHDALLHDGINALAALARFVTVEGVASGR